MKKSTKMWLKQKISWILIVLLSINSFAAVVGDSDGTAFVTKADFEELKEDFNKQIDRYNASLDEKIDGAISNYITGINLVNKTNIKPLVSNYKNIKWKNDLFVKVNERKWSNWNTYTDTTLKWQIPTFGEYRAIRAGRFNFTALRFDDVQMKSISCNINGGGVTFPADDGWFPSGEGTGGTFQPRSAGTLCIKCKEYDKGPALDENQWMIVKSGEMNDSAYPGAFGGDSIPGGNAVALATDGIIVSPRNDNELIRFKIRYHTSAWDGTGVSSNQRETGEFYLEQKYSSYGANGYYGPNVQATGLPTQIFNSDACGTFNPPIVGTFWPSNEQLTNDENICGYMMLGATSSTIANCMVELKNKKFSPSTSYDFNDSKLGSIYAAVSVAWSYTGQGRGTRFYSINSDTGAQQKTRFYLPLWPRYKIRELYTPRFKFQNNPLRLGDGLPIANNLLSNGILNIELKYKIKNGDVTATTEPSQNLYLSFKKTNFNDTTNDFYEDENGNKLLDVLWEPTTSDTTYKIKIPVKAEDDMWMRIGPKERSASGLYAEITDLSVIFENEY